MPTLADLIEHHLKRMVEEAQEKRVEIIRSELAAIFDCVPSQINYVLATRFTPARGFMVESQRGSGGHVRISRIQLHKSALLQEYLLAEVTPEISQLQAKHICDRMLHEGLISEKEHAIIIAATKRSSIPVPIPLRDRVRSRMMRAIMLEIVQRL